MLDAIELDDGDFDSGGLRQRSQIRLFTADSRIILYRAGHLKSQKLADVLKRVVEILS